MQPGELSEGQLRDINGESVIKKKDAEKVTLSKRHIMELSEVILQH